MADGDRKRQSKSEIVVVSALKDWSCAECGGGGSLLTMDGKGPLCLSCADMDPLVFLPAAVAASVRHRDTGYGELLMSGVERAEARSLVREEVESILESWRASSA